MSRLRNRFILSQIIAFVVLGFLFKGGNEGYRHLAWSVVAVIFMLYLPGYWISLWFFTIGELSSFERSLASVALSLALIIFSILYLQTFSLELPTMHIFLACWMIIVGSFIGLIVAKQ